MADSIPDLWPDDINVSTETAPVVILRQQAARLGEKTKNLVEAEVRLRGASTGDVFTYNFYLVAPALDNYQFLLFSVSHPIGFYPITIQNGNMTKEVKSEGEFMEALNMSHPEFC